MVSCVSLIFIMVDPKTQEAPELAAHAVATEPPCITEGDTKTPEDPLFVEVRDQLLHLQTRKDCLCALRNTCDEEDRSVSSQIREHNQLLYSLFHRLRKNQRSPLPAPLIMALIDLVMDDDMQTAKAIIEMAIKAFFKEANCTPIITLLFKLDIDGQLEMMNYLRGELAVDTTKLSPDRAGVFKFILHKMACDANEYDGNLTRHFSQLRASLGLQHDQPLPTTHTHQLATSQCSRLPTIAEYECDEDFANMISSGGIPYKKMVWFFDANTNPQAEVTLELPSVFNTDYEMLRNMGFELTCIGKAYQFGNPATRTVTPDMVQVFIKPCADAEITPRDPLFEVYYQEMRKSILDPVKVDR